MVKEDPLPRDGDILSKMWAEGAANAKSLRQEQARQYLRAMKSSAGISKEEIARKH